MDKRKAPGHINPPRSEPSMPTQPSIPAQPFDTVTSIRITIHTADLGDVPADAYEACLLAELEPLFPAATIEFDEIDRVSGTEPAAEIEGFDNSDEDWVGWEAAQEAIRDARQSAFSAACE